MFIIDCRSLVAILDKTVEWIRLSEQRVPDENCTDCWVAVFCLVILFSFAQSSFQLTTWVILYWWVAKKNRNACQRIFYYQFFCGILCMVYNAKILLLYVKCHKLPIKHFSSYFFFLLQFKMLFFCTCSLPQACYKRCTIKIYSFVSFYRNF